MSLWRKEMQMKHETAEIVKAWLDALSVVTVLGAIVEMLPSVAAIFTIVWTGIRIWETETVKGWRGLRKETFAEPNSSKD